MTRRLPAATRKPAAPLGEIGREVARRGLAFGMRVVAVDPVTPEAPAGVAALYRLDRLPVLLGESDFVVIAAPTRRRPRSSSAGRSSGR